MSMENQVPEEVNAERSRILLELDRKNTAGYVLAQMGRQVEILIEETLELDGKVYQTGHTREYIRAAVLSGRDLTNQIVSARVEKLMGERLFLCKLL